jgi:hypothetical protein
MIIKSYSVLQLKGCANKRMITNFLSYIMTLPLLRLGGSCLGLTLVVEPVS